LCKTAGLAAKEKEKSIGQYEYKIEKIRRNELQIQIQCGLNIWNLVFIYELVFTIEFTVFSSILNFVEVSQQFEL
jgi:hypothetical protein